MQDTFEFSGDHEWAMWREGVICSVCDTYDGTRTAAVGVKVDASNRDNVGARVRGIIWSTPVCEVHAAVRTYGATIYFDGRDARPVNYLEPIRTDGDALACAVESCSGDAHDSTHSPTIGICGHTGATYETLLAVIHPPATDIEWGATIYLRDGRRIDGMLANVPMNSPDWEDDCLPVREEEGDPAIWWIPFEMIAHIQIG